MELFYDRNNYLVSKRRGQDQRQTYSYDETGNLIEKIGEDNVRLKLLRNEVGNAVQHMYFNKETDQLLEQLNFNYDDVGRLISWSDAYFSGNYLYDTNGRKILESINYGDFTKTISYEYFANGETKNIFYPSGLTIEHAYAASNVLSRIDISDKSNISFVGDIWSSDQKAIFPGGVVLNKEYTELFYPIKTELTGTNFGEDISMEFEYSPLGELVIRRYDDHEVMYGYDKWSRIITESNLEGARRDYNYDELGNRTEDSAVQDNLIYNEKSELVKAGELSFKYNLSGNLEEVKRNENILWKLQYDVEQRLANIRTDSDSLIAKYEYDPFGRRISKSTVSGIIYYFYSDSGLMAEFSESGEIKRLYGYKPNSTWGTSPLFFMENGKTYFQHADFLGLPFAVTDQSGTLVWRGFYDAYGREMSVVGDVIVPQRFMGQYKDEETGMYYNYHRYYDPSIGRYIQRDPLGFISGQNEYLYANANSQSYVDPQGLLYDQVAEIAAQAYAEAQAALVEVDAASIGRGVGSAAGRVASICSFAIGLPLAILLDPTECADDDVVEPDVSPDQERNTPPKPRPPLPPIPRPDRRTRYCNAICRADVDENLPNNCSIGGKWYAFGESFAKKCRDARNQAEKIAKEKLGADKVKHVQCKCTPRSGPTGPC